MSNAAPTRNQPPQVALSDINLGSWDFWRRGDDWHHGAFATLRRESPIRFFPELVRHGETAGEGHWALIRHEHIRFASRHPEIFSSQPSINMVDNPPELTEYLGSMLVLDDPRHRRLRALVSRAFTPSVLAKVQDFITMRARTLVSSMIRNHPDRTAEFVSEIAAPFPLQVICDMMGIPEHDQPRIFDWTNVFIGFGDPEVAGEYDDYVSATKKLGEYGKSLAESRRTSQREDLTTSLVTAEVDGDHLTSEEIASFFLLLVVAGSETTRHALSHGLVGLTRFPEQRQLWWDDIDLRRQTAVEEILRWSSPVHYMRRTLTRDIRLNGVSMSAGQKATLWYTSANHDETVFDDPRTFDLLRHPNPHFALGAGGVHFCLGASLARREISALFEELHRQLPNITVTGEPVPLLSAFIHGIKHLQVGW